MAEKLISQPANIPSPETDPNALGPEVPLNDTDPILSQARNDAASRGRSQGLEGLAWQQGDITYKVSSYDDLLKDSYDKVRKGPRLYKRGTSPTFETKKLGEFGKNKRGLIVGLQKSEVHELVSKDTPTWVVDKFDINGELIETEAYSAQKLADQLASTDEKYPGMTGELSHMWWEDAPPKAPADLRPDEINRTEITTNPKDIFGSITDSRERDVHVPGEDWVGLTWTATARSSKMQVVKDSVRRDISGNNDTLVRTFLVKEYKTVNGIERAVGFKSYSAFDLKKYFNGVNLNNAHAKKAIEVDGLHWELPKKPVDPRVKTWAGHLAIRNTAPTNPVGAEEKAISEYLLGLHDITTGNPNSIEYQRKYIEEKANDPQNAKYAASLEQAIAEYGGARIRDLAGYMRDSYLQTIDKLSVQTLDLEKFSVSWVLWDLAKQRYYAEHPDELDINNPVDRDYINTYGVGSRFTPGDPSGIGSGPIIGETTDPWGLIDPFGDSPDALKKRRELVDREVGKVYVSNVLMKQTGKVRGVAPDGTVGERVITQYTLNPIYEDGLQQFVKHDVLDILNSVTDDDEKSPSQLSSRTLATLGRLLRRQLVQ